MHQMGRISNNRKGESSSVGDGSARVKSATSRRRKITRAVLMNGDQVKDAPEEKIVRKRAAVGKPASDSDTQNPSKPKVKRKSGENMDVKVKAQDQEKNAKQRNSRPKSKSNGFKAAKPHSKKRRVEGEQINNKHESGNLTKRAEIVNSPAKNGKSAQKNECTLESKKDGMHTERLIVDSQTPSASEKYVGVHCSIAGGVSNAVSEALSLRARAFGLFVRNGRTWKLNEVDMNEAEKFKKACQEYGFQPHFILPHGSYLLNCGSSNPETLQKSRDTLIHELQICEKLGLCLYNFHPGSACGDGTVDECIHTIAESINLAHKKTQYIKTVIENMAGQGSTVGGKLEELKAIIDKVHDKSRIGVCLDTCHAFAAGFDVSCEDGFKKFMEDFDKVIGLKYLCALHLNDSKGELGCHLDRHENIGKGRIGIEGFRCVMNDARLNNIPMILETPVNDYAKEIRTLCKLEKLA